MVTVGLLQSIGNSIKCTSIINRTAEVPFKGKQGTNRSPVAKLANTEFLRLRYASPFALILEKVICHFGEP